MADPLAGGSSFASCEPKTEYDEELDFLSPNFNPERALYSPHVSVPCPEIKLFESVKQYEDAIKSRSKSKHASENQRKKDEGTSVDKPNIKESSADIDKTAVQSKNVKAALSDSSTSDKPLALTSTACIKKPVERQEKLLTYAGAASGRSQVGGLDGSSSSIGQSEEQALDLSLKTSPFFTPARPSSSGRSSGTSQRSSEKLSKHSSTKSEEKPHKKSSVVKDEPVTPVCVGPHSSRGKSLNTSWRSAEPSGSHETKIKSHSATRSDISSRTLPKNIILTTTSRYEHLPDKYKTGERSSSYLSKSGKHLHSSASTDERRSHSASSHYSERQHSESPRRHEKSPRDTRLGSRFVEKSPNTPVRGQERTYRESQSSSSTLVKSENLSWRNPERSLPVAGGRDDRQLTSSLTSSERLEAISDNRQERKHSDAKQSYQPKNIKADTSRLQKTPAVTSQKKFPLQVQIPKSRVTDSSDASKSSSKKSTKVRNVFTRMENMAGPLRVLTRCVQEHLQVRVMTRGAVTVKSICRGYVVAFDKHFNIALIDVDEIYRRPAALGKIKSKRSKKLMAAQKTLQKEREEYVAKWNDEQSIQLASSSLQDLSLQTECSKDQKISSDTSKHQEEALTTASDPSCSKLKETVDSLFRSSGHLSRHASAHRSQTASLLGSAVGAPKPFELLSKSAQAKLRRIQSVYEGHTVPLSPFEREALMLGIADENVQHRHINQMLIRGENVVSVSIIEDF